MRINLDSIRMTEENMYEACAKEHYYTIKPYQDKNMIQSLGAQTGVSSTIHKSNSDLINLPCGGKVIYLTLIIQSYRSHGVIIVLNKLLSMA